MQEIPTTSIVPNRYQPREHFDEDTLASLTASVREIGESVGLGSPSTVHSHLSTLQRLGYLRRDPSKPRAIEVRFDPSSGAVMERRPVRHVPLVGEVAAGTDVLAQENVEEIMPVPSDFTGEGDLFMLRVRGDSMVNAGILDGDFVIVHSQSEARPGEIVVAGIPGEEATVKTFGLDDGRVGVAEDHGAPGADQVDVLVAVDVGQARTLRRFDEAGGAADGAEGAHRGVHPARGHRAGAVEEARGIVRLLV